MNRDRIERTAATVKRRLTSTVEYANTNSLLPPQLMDEHISTWWNPTTGATCVAQRCTRNRDGASDDNPDPRHRGTADLDDLAGLTLLCGCAAMFTNYEAGGEALDVWLMRAVSHMSCTEILDGIAERPNDVNWYALNEVREHCDTIEARRELWEAYEPAAASYEALLERAANDAADTAALWRDANSRVDSWLWWATHLVELGSNGNRAATHIHQGGTPHTASKRCFGTQGSAEELDELRKLVTSTEPRGTVVVADRWARPAGDAIMVAQCGFRRYADSDEPTRLWVGNAPPIVSEAVAGSVVQRNPTTITVATIDGVFDERDLGRLEELWSPHVGAAELVDMWAATTA